MGDVSLDDLERLAKQATPGPWLRHGPTEHHWDWAKVWTANSILLEVNVHAYADVDAFRKAHEFGTPEYKRGPEQPAANADFVAACDPQTILSLIARVRAAEAERDAARADAADAAECLAMVRDALAELGCGCPPGLHAATPPMMYGEWVACAVLGARRANPR